MIIHQFRTYKEDCTISRLYLDNASEHFCYVLEDPLNPTNGEKPCIPEDKYDITYSYSNRFKRDMLLLHNYDDYLVKDHMKEEDLIWSGIRIHGGNTVQDTKGCLLIGKSHDYKNKIWGNCEEELFNAIKFLILCHVNIKWVIKTSYFYKT